MKVYLDTVILIYWIEDVEPYNQLISAIIEQPEIELIASDLSWLEVRIHPLRVNNQTLLEAYQQCFDKLLDGVLPISRSVIDQATKLRAIHRFKTPDAIHLAVAIESKCDLFLTNDQDLTRCTEIKVHVIA